MSAAPAFCPARPRNGSPLHTAWPVAAEQVNVIAFLLEPSTHGGARPAYAETALSHMVHVGDTLYILRRPLRVNGTSLLTPEDRWHWCEARMRLGDGDVRSVYRPIPIVSRSDRLALGGPGVVEDWVLRRQRRRGSASARANGDRGKPEQTSMTSVVIAS